jgi:hypothetical protein
MITDINSENRLVQKTFADHRCDALDWESICLQRRDIRCERYAPRGASCLILGSVGGRPLHVVCGRLESDDILIITAYEPDPGEWENDWRTRKTRE